MMGSLPSTQTAALYRPGDVHLSIVHDYPVPKPGRGEVILKVLACGVCHTDTFLLSGATFDPRTYVLGHEVCGEVVAYGQGVDRDKIRMNQLYMSLIGDHNDHGVNGGPAIFNALGTGLDGGYEEYVKVREDLLVPVPPGVPPEVAAIAADAGITAYDAVANRAGLGPGTNAKVLMFGIGGVGHLGLQYAKHFGATVYACDIKPEARKLALELGATEAFSLLDLNNKITKESFRVDVVIDFVGINQTFQLGFNALKPNEVNFPSNPISVIVGVSPENFTLNSADLLATGAKILSTQYGSREDAVKALELFANGSVRAIVATEPLTNVNKIIDELRAFDVRGRKVVIPHGDHHGKVREFFHSLHQKS
ncbi:hypothetical protein D9758_010404 [Tetrapyrgos nigripes]|uniref:Enoyl reductase (ER) domain-containing protein n=1 Tax=Tetrapyrgos nigripes TaxID=182062 RepID=A0A8H5CZE9_9AGAR|nr:hypothetical protein D9758_010404 [Tetrapyrgos nigripes]